LLHTVDLLGAVYKVNPKEDKYGSYIYFDFGLTFENIIFQHYLDNRIFRIIT
jgi:hypothetical protein